MAEEEKTEVVTETAEGEVKEEKQKKKLSLSGIDDAAENKGSVWKTLWQIVKFAAVSLIGYAIQLILVYTLPLIFDSVTTLLPGFLQGIFNPELIFDPGSAEMTKYVIGGVVTWGYVIPFFLSNFIANIYGFFQNRKTTFKSDAPWYCLAIYIVVLVALILFSTWFQGLLYGWLTNVGNTFLSGIARFIASMTAGLIQFVVLFPIEKFVLLRERKKPEDAALEEGAEGAEEAEVKVSESEEN